MRSKSCHRGDSFFYYTNEELQSFNIENGGLKMRGKKISVQERTNAGLKMRERTISVPQDDSEGLGIIYT